MTSATSPIAKARHSIEIVCQDRITLNSSANHIQLSSGLFSLKMHYTGTGLLHWMVLAVLLCLAASSCQAQSENSEHGNAPLHSQVLIIGAGPAGVAAAARLMENGILDVRILEAEGRIGGRTNSVPFGDDVVDLGAQWVSGSVGNVVYEMANPLGLLEEGRPSPIDNMHYFLANGTVPDEHFLGRLVNISFAIMEDRDAMANYTGPFGQYFLDRLAEVRADPANNLSSNPELVAAFIPWMEKAYAFAEGSDSWWEVSAKSLNQSWMCEGDQGINWINGGYSSVINLLTKRYPNPAEELPVRNQTQLRSEVKTIHWGPNAVEGPKGTKVALVETSDGMRYTADFVIVTVSIGVLKENADTMFDPALPGTKMNAVQHIAFGQVDKLFLHFNETWWPSNTTGYTTIATEEDRTRFNQLYPEFLEKGEWATSLSGFYMVPRQPTAVLFDWLVGKAARNMEKYSDEEVKRACVLWLEMFVGRPLPAPVAFVRSKWYSNPHFRGSYSHTSEDQDKHGAERSHLADPLLGQSGNPEILFAGEATHDHYFGYVHGAIETGRREADRILRLLRNRLHRHTRDGTIQSLKRIVKNI